MLDHQWHHSFDTGSNTLTLSHLKRGPDVKMHRYIMPAVLVASSSLRHTFSYDLTTAQIFQPCLTYVVISILEVG